MSNFLMVLLLSAVMGLSIFIALPLFARRKMSNLNMRLLGSVAVGILIFLVADVFSDSASIMYNGSLAGYGTDPWYDLVFLISLVLGFAMLFFAEGTKDSGKSPYRLSFFIALGIGFQNLTEGLVFGASFNSIGLLGVTVVILVGFILQNITEGFPIVSPFIGMESQKILPIVSLFLIGGLPTIIGGGVGYFYSSSLFNLFFDGLAIGAMAYVIFPIIGSLLRNGERHSARLIYAGTFIGFVAGFLVNLI
ncbi:MAG: hypothetical protein QW597_06990 [Thermoplasmataceae archaeon]